MGGHTKVVDTNNPASEHLHNLIVGSLMSGGVKPPGQLKPNYVGGAQNTPYGSQPNIYTAAPAGPPASFNMAPGGPPPTNTSVGGGGPFGAQGASIDPSGAMGGAGPMLGITASPGGGGSTPDASNFLNGIFAQLPQGPPQVNINSPTSPTAASATGAQINPGSDYDNLIKSIVSLSTGAAQGAGAGGAPTVSDAGTGLQSVDQVAANMMGPNSFYSKTILPTLTNTFNQQNALDLAQAKESAGNLTGSGLAASLGSVMNRNAATQQQNIIGALQGLVSQQLGVNQSSASMAQQRNITSAQLQQQADAMRQQAMASGRSDLLAAANQMYAKAQAQAQLEQQNNQFNTGQTNTMNTNTYNQLSDTARTQAQLDQQNNLAQFAGALGISTQNAQALLSLIQGQSGMGMGQNTAVTSGGIGSILPGLASVFATIFGPGGVANNGNSGGATTGGGQAPGNGGSGY
jgi:hypothetical protein